MSESNSEQEWTLVETVAGTAQGEILRGLLEAQGIQVLLSQEGAGHFAFNVTTGPLGRVEVLVPTDQVEEARKLIEAYHLGSFQAPQAGDVHILEDDDIDESGGIPRPNTGETGGA